MCLLLSSANHESLAASNQKQPCEQQPTHNLPSPLRLRASARYSLLRTSNHKPRVTENEQLETIPNRKSPRSQFLQPLFPHIIRCIIIRFILYFSLP